MTSGTNPLAMRCVPDAEHLDLGGISFEAAGSHLSSVFAILA